MIASMVAMLRPYSTLVKADNTNPGVFSKDSAPYGRLMVTG
jgi:hypothetical protein